MKTSDVLRKAGDVLRRRGWQNDGGWSSDGGALCAWAALCEAGGRDAYGTEALEERGLVELVACTPDQMRLYKRLGYNALPTWNDAKGRTAAEVMHAIDAAYVLALQEEGVEPWEVLR